MLLSRSCWLPASLHRIGCCSSSTLRAPFVIFSNPTSASRAEPSCVCWAGRNGGKSGSSGSHALNHSSKSGPNSKHKHLSSSSSSNNNSKPGSSSDASTRSKGSKSQPLQQTSRASPEQLEAPSKAQISNTRSSRVVGAEQQQVTGRHSTYSSRSSNNSSSSSSSRGAFSSAPESSPVPGYAQLLVIGAGAAGLTAAYFAAVQGARVTVLERTRESGKKILMSGGSRCNVLPLEIDLDLDFVSSSSSSALRAVFSSWTLEQCHDWLSRDVGLHLLLEAETNKWFPASNSSREVRDCLVSACEGLGVRFVYNASVEGLTRPDQYQRNGNAAAAAATCGSSNGWCVDLANGSKVVADRIIMCTGGRSFPAVGTDGTGYNLLSGLGHKLAPQYAALTPLKGPHPGGQQLAGLTLSDVRLSALKPNGKAAAVSQRGGLLFTHKGYSGPAVLDLSHWLVRGMTEGQQKTAEMPKLVVNWLNEDADTWQQRLAAASGATLVENLLRKSGIKERLAVALCIELGITSKPLSQLRKTERQALLTALTAWQLPITGHEGYKKAEVTGGGVVLEQIDCKTMESRLLPGLHLCGEVLDVFGRIGGFNFYWAWVSGRAAGLGAAAALAAASAPVQAAQSTAQQKT